jgi:hypothetical protein
MGIGYSMIDSEPVSVFDLAGPDKYANFRPRKGRWRNSSIFQSFPGQLEENPLLRVHLHRFARRDAEYAWVKIPNAIEDACRPSVTAASFLSFGMAEPLQGKAIRWNLPYGAFALSQ